MSYFRPPVQSMTGYVPGTQPADDRYIKLNTNENPYPPAPAVVKALRRLGGDKLRKYPDPTALQFRTAAARILGVQPDMILAGNGSDDLLTIITRSFAGPGELIAYPWPTYSLYPVLAQIQEAQIATVPFPDDFSLPQQLAEMPAKIIFVSNPNSPTGTLIGMEQLDQLAGAIKGVLVIDEAYVDFARSNCLKLVHKHPNVIVLRTLSKSYSLAGLRFGFALARPDLIAGMSKVKDSYNCNAVAIELATVAIQQQEYLLKTLAKIRRGRKYLTGQLTRLGFTVLPSEANFIWATIGTPSGGQIYETLKHNGILVRYFDQQLDGLRITVGKDTENRQLIQQLKKILEKPKPRKANEANS